jgi:phosphoglycolate phosphatase
MLEAGFSRHIPMAIVSNKPRPITLATLTNMNIVQYFESVIGPECVTQIKPAPESLEAALAEISDARHRAGLLAPPADRASMLMTGDSGTDIQAGRAFGAKTCAVLGGYGNTEALLAEKADFVVQSAGELIALLQD